MPYRRLPTTNSERIAALDAIDTKWNATATAGRPFAQPLIDTITPLRTDFKREIGEAASALSAQTSATGAADLQALALAQFISHFIQVFNLAIARGEFAKSDRAYYQLDVSQSTVPALNSHADRVQWAQNLVAGEAARVTAGGAPMAMPAIAQITAALAAYQAANNAQSQAKDTFDREQEDIPAMLPAVDKSIRDIWDHLEFAYREESGPSRRRKCREWGIVYIPRPGEEPEEGATPEPPAPPVP